MLPAQSVQGKGHLSEVSMKSYRSRFALQENNIISSEEDASGCCRLASAVSNASGKFVAFDVRDAYHVHRPKWFFNANDTCREQACFAPRYSTLRACVNDDAAPDSGRIGKPTAFALHSAGWQKNSPFGFSRKDAWKCFCPATVSDHGHTTTIHGNFSGF
jgi:hypothetical protein